MAKRSTCLCLIIGDLNKCRFGEARKTPVDSIIWTPYYEWKHIKPVVGLLAITWSSINVKSSCKLRLGNIIKSVTVFRRTPKIFLFSSEQHPEDVAWLRSSPLYVWTREWALPERDRRYTEWRKKTIYCLALKRNKDFWLHTRVCAAKVMSERDWMFPYFPGHCNLTGHRIVKKLSISWRSVWIQQ